MPRPAPSHSGCVRPGFTLLEVIIALGILGFSMAVLTEVSRLSLMNSRQAARETEAAIVAQSVLAELESGSAELADFSAEWNPTQLGEPAWRYEVRIEQTSVQGMVLARVLVTELDPGDEAPTTFQLIRWFQDQEYLELLESQAENEAAAS
ncbi:hypothetical protein Pla123a_44380 [Posidoniimonas polymericola]|uniref:Type II secretion system protein I n=1 Tax=Posidoniimonas polymericola TaxID=2528002 RepID=A0A5C5XWV8_9BACT|nr:type II secretion system protein [Posidoniimonas polymericola]TWT67009.1 hypothetical protein Pla123a_44380 [Posidoniimonas polymericola]